MIYDQPRSATVVADGRMIAAKITKDVYMPLLADFHVKKLFQNVQDKLDFIRRCVCVYVCVYVCVCVYVPKCAR
jgi:hypothetical protein